MTKGLLLKVSVYKRCSLAVFNFVIVVENVTKSKKLYRKGTYVEYNVASDLHN